MFLLRGLGFVEFSTKEHRAVLLHAREIVAGALARSRQPSARTRTRSRGRGPGG
jgi:hypothetical protein